MTHSQEEILLSLLQGAYAQEYVSKEDEDGNSVVGWTKKSLESVCKWDGIECDLDDAVTKISLQDALVGGTIPKILGQLDSLTDLNLRGNEYHGEIPKEIFSLPNLKILDVSYNSLDGAYPMHLFQSESLVTLDISHNRYYGFLPQTIDSLLPPSIMKLDLSHNGFYGYIPKSIGDVTSLAVVDLSYNLFDGTIPSSLGKLKQLKGLFLDHNKLIGTIPPSLTRTDSKLIQLFLEGNYLSGTVPVALADLPDLKDLFIDENKFTGTLPNEICKQNLNQDFFEGTEYDGDDRDGCTSIACPVNTMSREGVYPCYPCPDQVINPYLGRVGRCYHQNQKIILRILYDNCGGDKWNYDEDETKVLNGWGVDEVPVCEYDGIECNNAGNVVNITLPGVGLVGKIPEEIGLLRHLEVFNVADNMLTGHLPSSLRFPPLEELDISGNRLIGYVPPTLCLTGDINGNGLDGEFKCDVIACKAGTYNNYGHAVIGDEETIECMPCTKGYFKDDFKSEMYIGSKTCNGKKSKTKIIEKPVVSTFTNERGKSEKNIDTASASAAKPTNKANASSSNTGDVTKSGHSFTWFLFLCSLVYFGVYVKKKNLKLKAPKKKPKVPKVKVPKVKIPKRKKKKKKVPMTIGGVRDTAGMFSYDDNANANGSDSEEEAESIDSDVGVGSTIGNWFHSAIGMVGGGAVAGDNDSDSVMPQLGRESMFHKGLFGDDESDGTASKKTKGSISASNKSKDSKAVSESQNTIIIGDPSTMPRDSNSGGFLSGLGGIMSGLGFADDDSMKVMGGDDGSSDEESKTETDQVQASDETDNRVIIPDPNVRQNSLFSGGTSINSGGFLSGLGGILSGFGGTGGEDDADSLRVMQDDSVSNEDEDGEEDIDMPQAPSGRPPLPSYQFEHPAQPAIASTPASNISPPVPRNLMQDDDQPSLPGENMSSVGSYAPSMPVQGVLKNMEGAIPMSINFGEVMGGNSNAVDSGPNLSQGQYQSPLMYPQNPIQHQQQQQQNQPVGAQGFQNLGVSNNTAPIPNTNQIHYQMPQQFHQQQQSGTSQVFQGAAQNMNQVHYQMPQQFQQQSGQGLQNMSESNNAVVPPVPDMSQTQYQMPQHFHQQQQQQQQQQGSGQVPQDVGGNNNTIQFQSPQQYQQQQPGNDNNYQNT